jgi:GNAT superfamily N-acetyltransferase
MRVRTIHPVDTHPLRRLVLRNNDPLAEVVWPGDDHPEGFHLGAFIGTRCIGIASFRPEANPLLQGQRHYRLRGMATHPDHQGTGVGTGILHSAIGLLREHKADLLWCNAREVALPFYGHNGFETEGGPFLVPGIGVHHLMYRKL